ncbi:MAG: sigma-70 family RNA polymerase sigma factor [Pirellula sp.]
MNTSNQQDERVQIREGGPDLLADWFNQHRSSLERIVHFRLHPLLRSRVDPSDVLQDAFITISRRIQDYVQGESISFFVWIRQLTIQTLIDVQRNHFRDKRDALREIGIPEVSLEQSSCLSIARFLVDDLTSPSQAAVKAEEVELLRAALESMSEIDREILAMRHFEQLNNQQVAEVLGLSPTAASNRYVRAAARLGEILKAMPSRRPS